MLTSSMPHQVLPSEEVFVVDDEPAICDLFAALFSQEGYQVTSFAEGDSFLAAARERTPAFILLDLHMPGRSGLDVLDELDAPLSGTGLHDFSAWRRSHGD